jgi:hypothetical protein
MDKIYAIKDINGYATEMRTSAAQSITENYVQNLDEFITIKQVINIIHKESVGIDDCGRPLLNEDANANIFDALVVWLHNSAVAKLAANDYIECAWDSKNNEMIFWTKDTEKQTVQKQKDNNNGSKTSRDIKKNKGV